MEKGVQLFRTHYSRRSMPQVPRMVRSPLGQNSTDDHFHARTASLNTVIRNSIQSPIDGTSSIICSLKSNFKQENEMYKTDRKQSTKENSTYYESGLTNRGKLSIANGLRLSSQQSDGKVGRLPI